MTPANAILVDLALFLPVALGVAYLIARLIQVVFGRRLRLGIATMTIVSVLGLSVGLLLGGLFLYGTRLWAPTALLLAAGSALALSFAVAGIAAALSRNSAPVDVAALVQGGETNRVEFKETARWNVRENRKDARMEQVVAKTVAAFLNSQGGTLVIGATDDGRAVGLERDFSTLRVPDADRFELWLRDMLSTALGRNAAALPRITFTEIDGHEVCAVQCPPAPQPVFLSLAKDGSSTDLWVRVGNSTRSLGVDEAVTYVRQHWRPTLGTVLFGRR